MSAIASIEIDQYALRAILVIPADLRLNAEQIMGLISAQGICFGINQNAIQEACSACNTEKRICVAEGHSAQELTKSALHTEQEFKNERPVECGEYIGALNEHTSNVDGMNVFGEKIIASQQKVISCIGAGLEAQQDHIYATRNGILMQDGQSCWHVVPDKDCQGIEISEVEVILSPDYMRASIVLDKHEFVKPQTLLQAVQKQKICFGLLQNSIQDALHPRPISRELCLSEGLYPQNGTTSQLEYLIDDKIHYQVNSDGSVDFRAASHFKNIDAGTALGRLHPASKGKSGMDIRGNRLEAKAGEVLNIEDFLDEGAMISPSDPQLIIAARNGIFSRNQSGQIGVLEMIVIKGDVDMSIGHIETPYPIMISGDIKEGFNVKSGSDITVEGLIEDARVSANGNLIAKKGILPGKNRIKAQGDLATLYIRDREVKARDLIVEKGIRRSIIHATGSITAQEILGGEAHAGESIHVEQLGNASNHRTNVFTGLNPYLNAVKSEYIAQSKRLHEELDIVATQVESSAHRASEMVKKYALLKAQPSQDATYIEQLRLQAKRAVDENNRLSERYRSLLRELNTAHRNIDVYDKQMRDNMSNSKVDVSGTAHAPCLIHIGRVAQFRVESPFSQVSFVLDGHGKIQLVPLAEIPEAE